MKKIIAIIFSLIVISSPTITCNDEPPKYDWSNPEAVAMIIDSLGDLFERAK